MCCVCICIYPCVVSVSIIISVLCLYLYLSVSCVYIWTDFYKFLQLSTLCVTNTLPGHFCTIVLPGLWARQHRVFKRGGTHWALMWHSTLLGVFINSGISCRYTRTIILTMAPISFWENSDPCKKNENILLAQRKSIFLIFCFYESQLLFNLCL